MPSWFVFDLGNVLIRLAFDRVIETICASCSADREELISLLGGAGGYLDLEKGLVSFDRFHAVICERVGYQGDVAQLRATWSDFFDGPVEGIERLLERVRARYGVAFLSNSNLVHEEVIAEEYGLLFRDHEPIVYSHRVGLAKPDHEIYRRLLEQIQADPGDVIYTDDLPANVAAAKQVGMRAYVFEGAAKLERQLEGDGLL